jgi:hypothetical protein
MPKANAAARLRAELLRKKMERQKAHVRVPMSTVVIPAYMRLMVAMEEQSSARLLATMKDYKEYVVASTGVPVVWLLDSGSSSMRYPPGTVKDAMNVTVTSSADTMPMVGVESMIFFASFSSFSTVGSWFPL